LGNEVEAVTMRILLTGAGGFVGSHLAARLSGAGHEVIGTTRVARPGADGLLPFDGTDGAARVPEGIEGLLHVGGATPANALAGPGAYSASVDFSRRLGDFARTRGVRTVIHLSSIAVHGGGRTLARGVVDETSELAPESDYGRCKRDTEAIFRELEAPGRLVVNLRPPLVYGPGARGTWAQLLGLVRSPLPLPFASVRNRRSFLGVDSLGDLVVAILGHHGQGGRSGAYVVADREVVSLREVCAALRLALGRRPGLLPFPPGLLAAALRGLGKKEAAAGLFGDLVIDASRVESAFLWVPSIPTLEGMARSLVHPPKPDPTR
jgi:nucleoside-diphosphate-sugar epimerase